MRLESLSVALRPRNAWEAMDLGNALVRRNAGAIWRPWLLLTLPFFALINLACWLAELLWLAPILMWWLKPWFDRVPLYVLSRAVFGSVPGTRQTLTARELWTTRSLLAWLTWRRLSPSRALLLPVDMLEALTGERRQARAEVLQRAVSSQALGLMLALLHFELVVFLSVWVLGLMFVPEEFLSESARALWATFAENPPDWANVVANAVLWGATTLLEPFYVGAGFGLYLNRRTQLEAWDIELVFRRLVDRVQSVAAPLLVACGLLLVFAAPLPASAAVTSRPDPITPEQFVGPAWRPPPDRSFHDSIDRAYADPLLAPKETVTRWVPKDADERKPDPDSAQPAWLKTIAAIIAFIGEYGLWILLSAGLLFVLWRLPRWLPWVRERVDVVRGQSVVTVHIPETPAVLPDDVAAAAQRLWQEARQREALALLYRGSVARVAQRLGAPFPPGATEAECLRRAARLPDEALRADFAAMVRAWQAAAYAWRFPDDAQFDVLVRDWSQRYGAPP